MKPAATFLLFSVLTACTPANYATPATTPAPAAPAQMLVYDAYLSLVVPQADSAAARLLTLLPARDGYLLNRDDNRLTLRLPAERLDATLDELATWGRVRTRNLSGQDVTAEYFDDGLRLENAQRSRARYLELLARAQTVDETLAVERELERLNETIDLLEGRRRRLEHLTAMATLTVDFNERTKLGPLGYVFKGLWTGVRWLFVR